MQDFQDEITRLENRKEEEQVTRGPYSKEAQTPRVVEKQRQAFLQSPKTGGTEERCQSRNAQPARVVRGFQGGKRGARDRRTAHGVALVKSVDQRNKLNQKIQAKIAAEKQECV